MEEHGGEVATVRTGLDKFGSRWALVNMETKRRVGSGQSDQTIGRDGVEGQRDLCQVER